jgi:hypothetical protein
VRKNSGSSLTTNRSSLPGRVQPPGERVSSPPSGDINLPTGSVSSAAPTSSSVKNVLGGIGKVGLVATIIEQQQQQQQQPRVQAGSRVAALTSMFETNRTPSGSVPPPGQTASATGISSAVPTLRSSQPRQQSQIPSYMTTTKSKSIGQGGQN